MPAQDKLIRTYNGEFITPSEAAERAQMVEDEHDIRQWVMGEIPRDSGAEGGPFVRMLAPADGEGFGIPVLGDTQQEADAAARALLGRLGL